MDEFLASEDQLAYAKSASPELKEQLERYAVEHNDLALFFVAAGGIDLADVREHSRLNTPENQVTAKERLCANPLKYQDELVHLACMSSSPELSNSIALALMGAGMVYAAGRVMEYSKYGAELLDALHKISPTDTRVLFHTYFNGSSMSDEVVDWMLAHYGSPDDTRLGGLLLWLSRFRLSVVERIANTIPGAFDHFPNWEVWPKKNAVGVASQFILHGRGRKLHPIILAKHPELARYAEDCGVRDYVLTQTCPGWLTLSLVLMLGDYVPPFYLANMEHMKGEGAPFELPAHIATAREEVSSELAAYLDRQTAEYRAEYQDYLERVRIVRGRSKR